MQRFKFDIGGADAGAGGMSMISGSGGASGMGASSSSSDASAMGQSTGSSGAGSGSMSCRHVKPLHRQRVPVLSQEHLADSFTGDSSSSHEVNGSRHEMELEGVRDSHRRRSSGDKECKSV